MKINKSRLAFVQSDNRNSRSVHGTAATSAEAASRKDGSRKGIASEAVSARGSSGRPLHEVWGVIYQDSVRSVNISLRWRFCEHGCLWNPITTQAGGLDHLPIGGSEHSTGQFSSVTRSRLRAGVGQRRSQARSVVPSAKKPLPLSPGMLLSGRQMTDRL